MKPLGNKIQLDIKEVKIGAIQSDAIEEHGIIIAIGKPVSKDYTEKDGQVIKVGEFEVGKTLYFKAWAVDVVSKDSKKYYFISADSDAICAISD